MKELEQGPAGAFACMQGNPGAITRLFLFPYAGAGPAAFKPWTAELPGLLDVRVAHYPGRGSRHREPPMTDLRDLAAQLSRAIPPLLDRPFAFFGHSLGALVAFELIRCLVRDSGPVPQVLFVSAAAAPHLPHRQPLLHTLPDREFLDSLERLHGIPSALLGEPEALRLLLPVLRADLEALENYVHVPEDSPLPCPIVALGGLEDPRVRLEDLEAWMLHTTVSFRSQHFPGDHFFIHTARAAVITAVAAALGVVYE